MAACADWRTLREIEIALGLPLGNHAHANLRAMCHHEVTVGRLESRRLPGSDAQYRAVAGRSPPRAVMPIASGIYAALDEPMDTREISDALGITSAQAYRSLGVLQRRGLVKQVRARPVAIWVRTDAKPLSNPLKERDGRDGNRERDHRSRRA